MDDAWLINEPLNMHKFSPLLSCALMQSHYPDLHHSTLRSNRRRHCELRITSRQLKMTSGRRPTNHVSAVLNRCYQHATTTGETLLLLKLNYMYSIFAAVGNLTKHHTTISLSRSSHALTFTLNDLVMLTALTFTNS